MDEPHLLLICTVGGTPDPIVASIRHWKPARVLFVPSQDTRPRVDDVTNVPELLRPGDWDMVRPLGDAENFADCVRRMRVLDEHVENWRRKGPGYDVVVDFTGGTKCMSAALALVSRRWPCIFSYVGGTARTKEGTGIVVGGSERTRVTQNPWNGFGYQAIEEACLLFDEQAFRSAASLLQTARENADDNAVRRTLSTFHLLCEGYGYWDRFRHGEAAQRIDGARKNAADLREALGQTRSGPLLDSIDEHLRTLQQIVDQPQSRGMVADLLANARRRQQEARYDDGVARLYRAIESLSQLALAERHAIPRTDKVALDCVPEPLRGCWTPRSKNGELLLGLQDQYELLDTLGDELGKLFKDLELQDQRKSPLTARNHSILAHGFQPVREQVFERLWDAAMRLGGFSDHELPRFPRLAAAEATP